jgi:hypothetical protein
VNHTKDQKIEMIVNFVNHHPESTVSLRVARELIGDSPVRRELGHITELRSELEAAEEWVVDSYYYLVK